MISLLSSFQVLVIGTTCILSIIHTYCCLHMYKTREKGVSASSTLFSLVHLSVFKKMQPPFTYLLINFM